MKAALQFEALYREHRAAVLSYLVRRVDDPADAADLLADVFLVAWRRIGDVPTGDAARPWLYGVARRTLANHRRGARRRSDLARELRAHLADTPAPGTAAVDVVRALASLPELDREIVRLRSCEGLSHADIGLVIGLSEPTVRVRLHRVRQRLRRALSVTTS